MLYKTTDKHEKLRDEIREFAEAEVKPITFQLDQENEFPMDQVQAMKRKGWFGLPFSEEYGGQGEDILSYAIAVEELSRVDGGTGVILSAHTSLGTWPIYALAMKNKRKSICRIY